jgi:hypothetical protein
MEARGTESIQLAGFVQTGGTGRYSVQIVSEATGSLSVTEVAGADQIQTVAFRRTPVPGTWARLVWTIALATPATVRVVANDEVVVDGTLAPYNAPTTRDVRLGLSHFTAGGWRIRYDDATIVVR